MTSVRRLDVTCGDTELSTISKGDVRFDYVPSTIGREAGIVAFDKFFRISLHCKLVPVQTGEYVMFYLSLGCSLVKLCVMLVKIRFFYREPSGNGQVQHSSLTVVLLTIPCNFSLKQTERSVWKPVYKENIHVDIRDRKRIPDFDVKKNK